MTPDQLLEIYNQVAKWAVPIVLGFAINYLRQINERIGQLSTALGIAVTRLDHHEKRLDKHDTALMRDQCDN